MTARRPTMAIDPGPEQSAFLVLGVSGHPRPGAFGIWPNADLLQQLRGDLFLLNIGTVAIEHIESFGMAVGREVFETVRWAGRFEEAVDRGGFARVVQVSRRAVKLTLCGSARAKDANIRQALIDRFGGSAAIGRKADPGPLYGISKDVWSALAIAVTHVEKEGVAA